MYRKLSLYLAAVVLAFFAASPTLAHEGLVLKVAEGKLTVVGKNKKEYTHDVARARLIRQTTPVPENGRGAAPEAVRPHSAPSAYAVG